MTPQQEDAVSGLDAPTFLGEPGPLTASPRYLRNIPLLISGGSEIVRYREIAQKTLVRLSQMLRVDLKAPYVFTEFDYLIDSSRDEEPGHIPDRSLEAVDGCEGVIAIVTRSVPEITRLEIRRVYELRQLGYARELWFFAVRSRSSETPDGSIPLPEFKDEILRDFGKERIYHRVNDKVDFQASLLVEMLPFVVQRAGTAFSPSLVEGARL